MKKVIIFASDGFQGSGLEEIVNYSWDNINNNNKHSLQRLYYEDIIHPTFNTNQLIEYNRTGMTIIVPNKEGDFISDNFNTEKAFHLGCQFIATNFQSVDNNMNYYITEFKDKSFVLKSIDLQKGTSNKKKSKK